MRKSKLTRSLAVLTLAALAGPGPFPPAAAWAQAPPAPEVPVFGTSTAAVVVDVVVRDKKGKLVRDLTAADFTVLEDGAPQAIESLRVVDNAPAAEEAAAGPASCARPARGNGGRGRSGQGRTHGSALRHCLRLRPAFRACPQDGGEGRAQLHRSRLRGRRPRGRLRDRPGPAHPQLFTNDVKAIKVALNRAATQGNTGFSSERQEARERTAPASPGPTALSRA